MTLEEIQLAFKEMDYGQVILFNNLGESWLAPLQSSVGMYNGSISALALEVDGLTLEDKETLCLAIQEDEEKEKRYGYKPCEVR